ncbi:hypothetical protein Dda_2234 [Drechslerella dactyloides]|uniref:Phosphatidic acid phosphatase type 2/haloperoxidase domain-containing protein n=1 Tax=Drechslerella dactyloides TaxID=74499 RepID=A0AAD6NMU2_DREDA|nr:hypothetical protein Dda_2234 [Drechslerella dactyloides]
MCTTKLSPSPVWTKHRESRCSNAKDTAACLSGRPRLCHNRYPPRKPGAKPRTETTDVTSSAARQREKPRQKQASAYMHYALHPTDVTITRAMTKSVMGFFTRNNQPGAAHRDKPSVSTQGTAPNAGAGESSPYAFINRRPTFGGWLKTVWLDLLTMAALGAIGLGVYEAPPAPTRNFPILFNNGEIVYPEIAYPLRKNIIPIWLAAFLASIIPITFILLLQIRIKSFWDASNAILGLLYSLINAAVFQVFLKWLIGGLRPHFLAACNPDPSMASSSGTGFGYIMFTRTVCRGDKDEIDDSLESFPSGHSTAAFAGFVFLFLWLNAKLKLWSNYHPAMWKMTATYAPLLGATLIAGSLTIDEFHHWYDVLAGAIIGTICAFGSYRMVYAAIWDWRYNHIPLPRGHDGISFGKNMGYGGFENAVFTRKAGWGNFVEGVGAGAAYAGHPHRHHHRGHHGRSRSRSVGNGNRVYQGPEAV